MKMTVRPCALACVVAWAALFACVGAGISEEDKRYCSKYLLLSETLEKDCETGAVIALDPRGTRPSPVYPMLCCLGFLQPFIRLTITDRNYLPIMDMTLVNYIYYLPDNPAIDGEKEVVNLAKYLGSCYERALQFQPPLKYTYLNYAKWKLNPTLYQCHAI